jgi:hypothetical protein
MKPLAIGKAIKTGIVALLRGHRIESRDAAKAGKILAGRLGVLLPLALDRTPGPVRVFDWQEAHD